MAPPQSQWGPPAGQPGGGFAPQRSGGSFDPKSVNPLDWALVGIGVILLLFSFFDYYTVDAGGFSDSASAWHFGSGAIIGWLAFIAGLAAAVIAALGVFMPTVKLPVANYVAAIGLFALSTLLYILGFFIIGPDDSACLGNSQCENAFDDAFGFGFSYWLSFIVVIVGIVVALMRAQQTNTALPGALGSLPTIGGPRPGGPPAPPR
jgi:hypothetical protein